MSAAAFALFATKADAATLTFNPGGATWDTTNTYWNAGATAWTNGDDAIFGAAGAQSVNLTTNINAASITIQAAGYNISQNGNTLTVGSGGISTTATASLSGFTMGANQTVDVGSSSTLNVGTVVGAAQTLTKSGAGTLNVGTSNLGGVILNAGTISGGTLSSASAFDLRAGTVSATLGGSFGINKTTGGIVILSGNNSSLSGAVNVSAGSLVAQNANALGSGAVTVTGADLTLRSDTNTTFANNVTLDATSTVTVDRVTSGANVTHTLSGTTTLSGDTLNVVRGGNVTGTATLDIQDLSISGITTFNVGTGA
jgi:autotransporter-associated beta strand protein